MNIFKRLHSERGFTLMELVIGIALIALVGTATVVTLAQIISMNARTQANVTEANMAASTSHWLTSDIAMAQEIDLADSPSLFPVTIKWMDWEASKYAYTVTYSIDGNNLVRTLIKTKKDGSEPPTTQSVTLSNCILSPDTHCTLTDGAVYFHITFKIGNTKALSAEVLVYPRATVLIKP